MKGWRRAANAAPRLGPDCEIPHRRDEAADAARTAAAARRTNRPGARLGGRRRPRTIRRPKRAKPSRSTSRWSTRSLPWSPRWRFRPMARRSPSRAIAKFCSTRWMAARRPSGSAGLSERILSLAFSKDGSLLAAGGGTPARFGEIQLWDVAVGQTAPLHRADRRYRVRRFALAGRNARGGRLHRQHGAHRGHGQRQGTLQDGRARKLGAGHGVRRRRQAHRLGGARPLGQTHRCGDRARSRKTSTCCAAN